SLNRNVVMVLIFLSGMTREGGVAFKILASRIYMLESMKDIMVATKLSHVDLERSFRRKSRGGAEQIQMTILKEILEGRILSDTKDRWTWSLEGSGEFSVSSIRKTIDAAFLPCGNVKTRGLKRFQSRSTFSLGKFLMITCLPDSIFLVEVWISVL
nr:RNA-directed DNA polymerase, eukaryota, reverse transcriptase zinc-binding domain protein [Tanacetum cinerariifolium]